MDDAGWNDGEKLPASPLGRLSRLEFELGLDSKCGKYRDDDRPSPAVVHDSLKKVLLYAKKYKKVNFDIFKRHRSQFDPFTFMCRW